jgi:hypothetical protein
MWPIVRSLGSVDRLTPGEVRELYRARPPLVGRFRRSEAWMGWQVSDQRKRLIECNIPIALVIAPRFVRLGDDAVGAAMVGLCNGVDRFDLDRGYTISTYLSRTIRNELMNTEVEECPFIYVPRNLYWLVKRECSGGEIRHRRESDRNLLPLARHAMRFGNIPFPIKESITDRRRVTYL